jgi:transcriptional regulator of acetoin/glycerol metabolism
MNEILDLQGQQVAWLEFIEHQKIHPNVQPLVANSWKRWIGRMNPFNDSPLKRLSDEHLLASQVASFDLLSVARPVMEDIYQFVERSDTVIALANSAGYILDMCGDPDMMQYTMQYELMPGTSVSETEIGTNAFGLSLTDRIPTRVVGTEHFLHRFHELAEAAAPIFDLSGRSLGVIGLITPVNLFHPHTLSAAVAGARAIEGQLQSDYLLAEQNTQLAQLNAILAANSEGVLVWNTDRVLMHINPAAAQILGIPESKILGRHIGDFISYPEFIREAAERRESLTDVEVNLNIDGRSVSCVISMRYVIVNEELQWIIITARQEKDVRRFVQSQVGAHASLTLADLPGESSQMKTVRHFIKSAALAEVSVLIQGESGTGKNPAASAIHNESSRRDGPFLIFPCSSVPSELVVQELLGFDEGLSEKMPGGRPSKFELAHGGTMYFQDVEALPLEAQGILLNVIDLGIVQRLGSKRPIEVDTRIIAATSANIEGLVNKENFRRGLFYRLRSLEIRLPPLRERRRDLPILLDRILERLSKQLNRRLEFDPGVVTMLNRYSWPGNIRELEAVINRAAAQAGFAGIISTAHLPEYIRHPQPSIESSQGLGKVLTLSEIERDSILRTVEMCNGNVSAMARSLGISRTTMWRKLKRLGISPQEYRKTNTHSV